MLDRIPDADELRCMDEKELAGLAQEIRKFLIEITAEKGGHLSSNLGTVELTLALFAAFDFPEDKVIWDVGHQAYTWKLLSGRKERFDTLRELNGLSGFPKRCESEYDVFDTGHSTTSVSAGLGLVKARDLSGENYRVISVIGDGSMTGGMAFEALNNASQLRTNYIIILNDNDMSISKNVGGVRRYLTNIRAGRSYNRMKDDVKSTLTGIPKIGKKLVQKISDTKDSIKEIVMPGGMFFENIGITYLGPVDGHNVTEMKRIFLQAKELNRCVLIHVCTKKGKGYGPAEERPDLFHGVEPFDIETGLPKKEKKKSCSDIFGEFITEAAVDDPKICAITAAMGDNVGLRQFAEQYPDRFFDVGIAEEHAVTFSAGLAAGGMHPYVAVFSSFLQRAYDQIIHDVCMQDYPVTFAVDRSGIVGRDGETHQGAFDLAYFRSIPGITVMAPKNDEELKDMLRFTKDFGHPCAVRYPRGACYSGLHGFRAPLEYGKAEILQRGNTVCLLAFGGMVETAAETETLLHKKGIHATVVNMRFVKPWDKGCVDEMLNGHRLIVTMEDGVLSGGIGEEIAAYISGKDTDVRVIGIGIPDRFVPQGDVKELKHMLHMDAETAAERITEALSQAES